MIIRTMTAADIPFAMRLKAQNGWNQLEADWQRQLDLEPEGCFVACLHSPPLAGRASDGNDPSLARPANGKNIPVGTACACVFGDVAWINMVLVDKDHRGQGIGTALMKNVLAWLDSRGVPTIRLDATPLGQPVYEKLGFIGDFTLNRFAGTFAGARSASKCASGSHACAACSEGDLPALLALDARVAQTRREKLLWHLYETAPELARQCVRSECLEGFCFCRPGANAWQIGPIQGSADAGRALLLDVATRFAGRQVYIDIPAENSAARALAQELGLTVQRSFLRMSRGRGIDEDLQAFWASFGPEKG